MSMPREEDDSGDRGGKGRLPKLGERIIHWGWTCIEEVQGCHTCFKCGGLSQHVEKCQFNSGDARCSFFTLKIKNGQRLIKSIIPISLARRGSRTEYRS